MKFTIEALELINKFINITGIRSMCKNQSHFYILTMDNQNLKKIANMHRIGSNYEVLSNKSN